MRLFPLLALSLRPAGRACALATLLAGATLLGGCQSDGLGLPGEEEAKDKETRLEYYETAALTYYDGGSYDRAEQMAERWLKESPGDKKALRVLARSKLNQGTPTKLREAERILVKLVDLDWTHPTRGNIRWEVQSDLAQVYTDLADLYHREIVELEGELRGGMAADPNGTEARLAKQRGQRDSLLGNAELPVLLQGARLHGERFAQVGDAVLPVDDDVLRAIAMKLGGQHQPRWTSSHDQNGRLDHPCTPLSGSRGCRPARTCSAHAREASRVNPAVVS